MGPEFLVFFLIYFCNRWYKQTKKKMGEILKQDLEIIVIICIYLLIRLTHTNKMFKTTTKVDNRA